MDPCIIVGIQDVMQALLLARRPRKTPVRRLTPMAAFRASARSAAFVPQEITRCLPGILNTPYGPKAPPTHASLTCREIVAQSTVGVLLFRVGAVTPRPTVPFQHKEPPFAGGTGPLVRYRKSRSISVSVDRISLASSSFLLPPRRGAWRFAIQTGHLRRGIHAGAQTPERLCETMHSRPAIAGAERWRERSGIHAWAIRPVALG